MTPAGIHIDVAVALPVHKTFTYGVPESLVAMATPGKRVLVPFGRREATGYILGEGKSVEGRSIKLILDLLDETPLFPESMVPFFKWIANYYIHPLGDVIKGALPGGINIYDVVEVFVTEKGETAKASASITPVESEVLSLLASGPLSVNRLLKKCGNRITRSLIYAMTRKGLLDQKRRLERGRTRPRMERMLSLGERLVDTGQLSEKRGKIIEALREKGEMSLGELNKTVPSASRALRPMAEKGLVSIVEKPVYRDPFGESIARDTVHTLTAEQKNVVSDLKLALGQGFETFLLAGVTGSGKTEVYLHLAKTAMDLGLNVLVLVPEIALISQMEHRFRARFGERVAVLHSGLSAGERYDQWMRIVKGEVPIAVGARSAIFAPFQKLGVIIVDEEHDTSYKQEGNLRYNARDLAVVRAKYDDGIALLGSATPSIQSTYNARTGKFKQLVLANRVENRPLAHISVVNLCKTRDSRGIRRFISPELHGAMEKTLARGEQILLFLNRRGFAAAPVCGACGEAIRCKNCDITLTLHKKANAYKCHYCGFSLPSTSVCPSCGFSGIKLLGFGTEKVEEAVKALFPDARVARMDRDTTTRKGALLKILKGLRDQSIDILVGTQMVAKGHDFPNITLVGVVCADLSMSFPDFRAGERTFQLLAQVSGRAGRGERPGQVILQTYAPDHYSIQSAKEQDWELFYGREVGFRKCLRYPPYSRMVQLKISGKEREKTSVHARRMGDLCHLLNQGDNRTGPLIEVLGPIEASLSRIANRYRWQILLKGPDAGSLHHFVCGLLFDNHSSLTSRDIKVAVDVDPFFMM
jgi:primosomal protein N' (replication factor Y) (superfamily II helicase)